jgi:hypothetical protein
MIDLGWGKPLYAKWGEFLLNNILRFSTYNHHSCEVVLEDAGEKVHIIADFREVIRFKKEGESTVANVKIFQGGDCLSEENYQISETKKRSEIKRPDGSVLVVENVERLWENEHSKLREDITSRNGEFCAYLLYEDGDLVKAVSQNDKGGIEKGIFKERITGMMGRGRSWLKALGLSFEIFSILCAVFMGYLLFDPNTPALKLVLAVFLFVISKLLYHFSRPGVLAEHS